jgi:hypothetical protein
MRNLNSDYTICLVNQTANVGALPQFSAFRDGSRANLSV